MIWNSFLHTLQYNIYVKLFIVVLFVLSFKIRPNKCTLIFYLAVFFLFGAMLWVNNRQEDPDSKVLPVVMWHGMGDSCCLPFSLGAIKSLLQTHLNNTYVKSLEIGGNVVTDYESGFFIHPNTQIDYVCTELAKDEKLKNGYNAIGFSQGSQFLRAVAQRCPYPPMKVLISLGGQHQGIFGLPKCPSLKMSTCEYIREKLSTAAYKKWIQKELVQATFWHDPLQEDEYRLNSTFLSDINSEVTVNEQYAENLNKLTKFVMVKFLNDTIVQPLESQWFEFYAPGQDEKILPLKQSLAYENIGLAQMDMDNKLLFLVVEGDHLQMKKDWFVENLIPLLKNE